ncbi:MAG: 30S ribosomal protein S16 [Erysipelotrichaceae bacterium]|nr:30S ribosomal protein S16 [Erysipelotrichaceae bacterium]
MVKMRLKRMGAKKSPFYRVVVSDSRSRRDGREIEVVGNYDPRKNPAVINIDEEKALKWLNDGAAPTDTVRNILSTAGIMKKFADGKKAAK